MFCRRVFHTQVVHQGLSFRPFCCRFCEAYFAGQKKCCFTSLFSMGILFFSTQGSNKSALVDHWVVGPSGRSLNSLCATHKRPHRERIFHRVVRHTESYFNNVHIILSTISTTYTYTARTHISMISTTYISYVHSKQKKQLHVQLNSH